MAIPTGAPGTYKGDSLWSYEVGSKNRLFHGRFETQVSVFHIDWTDIQQIVQVPAGTEGFTSNLGKVQQWL